MTLLWKLSQTQSINPYLSTKLSEPPPHPPSPKFSSSSTVRSISQSEASNPQTISTKLSQNTEFAVLLLFLGFSNPCVIISTTTLEIRICVFNPCLVIFATKPTCALQPYQVSLCNRGVSTAGFHPLRPK